MRSGKDCGSESSFQAGLPRKSASAVVVACTPIFNFFRSSNELILVPVGHSALWSDLKYGIEKSTTLARSSVMVTCDKAMS
jgi:hypothetical protein